MDHLASLASSGSDTTDFNFEDYINFPADDFFIPDPLINDADFDGNGLDPSGLDSFYMYPHNSSNLEIDLVDQFQGLSSFASSLESSSAATPQFQDPEDLEALLGPFDHSSLVNQHGQQELFQIPQSCQSTEAPNPTALIPDTGNSGLIRTPSLPEGRQVSIDLNVPRSRPPPPNLRHSSFEQGSLISIQSGAHGINERPLYNPNFNLGPSYNAHSGGHIRARRLNVHRFPTTEHTAPKSTKMSLRCQWTSCKGKQFDTRESLSDHFSVHYAALLNEATKDGIFVCRWHDCSSQKSGKSFPNLAVLRKHLTGHVKKYWCLDSRCALAFARKSDLARHILHIHSSDRSYPCSVTGCDRSYKRKDKLDEHLRKDHDHWGCPFDHCTAQVLGGNRETHLAIVHGGQDLALMDNDFDGVYECGFPSCESTTSKFTFTNACAHLRSCHFLDNDASEVAKSAKDFGLVNTRDLALVLSPGAYTGEVYHCRICPRTTTARPQLEPKPSLDSTHETLSSMKLSLRPF